MSGKFQAPVNVRRVSTHGTLTAALFLFRYIAQTKRNGNAIKYYRERRKAGIRLHILYVAVRIPILRSFSRPILSIESLISARDNFASFPDHT